MGAERRVSWRDRYPEEVTCVRCLEVRATDDLDRLLWCPDCRRKAARRAQRRGWAAGVVLAGLLASWIFLVVRPDRDLVFGGWIATIVAAFWIGAKVARELAYGWERYRNRRAIEAVPPALPGEGGGGDEGGDRRADAGGGDGRTGSFGGGDRASGDEGDAAGPAGRG